MKSTRGRFADAHRKVTADTMSLAMKTKWGVYVLCSFLFYMCLLNATTDDYESPSRPFRRKNIFQITSPKRIRSTDTEDLLISGNSASASSSRGPHVTFQSPQLHTDVRLPSMEFFSPERPGAKIQSLFAYLPDVSVTCSTSDFVVRVKKAFYGLGANAEELKIGTTCKSNGVLLPYGDLLFTYSLTDCDVQREMHDGYLGYTFVLNYESSPQRFSNEVHRINVNLECRFQRHHHVHQLAVRPTWQTAYIHKRLTGRLNEFRIQLMDDSWAAPVQSPVYHLGQTVNFQVSGSHLPAGGKLYISSCYSTPANGSKSSPTYTIIDNFGCLLDSWREPWASQFVSPRTDNTIRFSLRAFQFISEPDTEVNVHCMLVVTLEDPDPEHKSCTYKENGWSALIGDDSICDCCESQCVTSKPQQAMKEGLASTGVLLVSDRPLFRPEHGVLPQTPSQVNRGGEVELGDTVQLEPQKNPRLEELHSAGNLQDTSDFSTVDGHADESRLEDVMDTVGLRLGHIMEEEQQSGDGEHGPDYAVRKEFLEGVIFELTEVEMGVNDGQGSDLEKEDTSLLWVRDIPVSEGDKFVGEEEHVYTLPVESNVEESVNVNIGRNEESEQSLSENDLNNDRVSEDGMTETGMVSSQEMALYFTWR